MPTSGHFRFAIAAYLRELSDWRRRKYDDDLRDPRNLRSADALLDLSRYIDQLASTDVRLLRLAELTVHYRTAPDLERLAGGRPFSAIHTRVDRLGIQATLVARK